MTLKTIEFKSYKESVPELLKMMNVYDILKKDKQILIKPNLVNASPYPVTTPPDICEEIILWIRKNFNNPVVIAEGTGDIGMDTFEVFSRLGYTELGNKLDVPLIDLNEEKTVLLKDSRNTVFPEFHMPEIAMNSFILSVPVLKAHSLAQVTGTLKNMMGFAPPLHYQSDNRWKKSEFHKQMHRSITELNRFRTPDLTIIDAVVGLAEYHLGGPECSPRVNKLIGGTDPLEVDREAARLLGFDCRSIPHLA